MHDLLHDLAKYVYGKFCYTLKVKEAQSISKMTCHFSFLCDETEYFKGFETLYHADRLVHFYHCLWIPININGGFLSLTY